MIGFTNVFDLVPRDILISEMPAWTISKVCLRGIDNWLTNRSQKSVVNGKSSSNADIFSGVPQGSGAWPNTC